MASTRVQVFSKVMKGKYNLGADSANIVRLESLVSRPLLGLDAQLNPTSPDSSLCTQIVQDRLTGALQEEKMAVYVVRRFSTATCGSETYRTTVPACAASRHSSHVQGHERQHGGRAQCVIHVVSASLVRLTDPS